MPAGNDAAGAAADLVSKGGVTTNVERLIEAQRASLGADVIAASLRSIDGEATAQLDLSAAKVPEGHKVLAGAVRGNAAVYVVEGPDGRTYKMVEGYTDDYEAPSESADDAFARQSAHERANEAGEIARIKAESEKRLEEARREIAAAEADELRKIQEDAQKRLAKAEKEAQKEGDDDGSAGNVGEVTAPSDPAQGGGPKRAGDEKKSGGKGGKSGK